MEAGPQPSPLRRRLFRARLGATLTGRGTALALGAVLLITASAYVLGVRGVLGPQAWKAGLAAGAGFAMLRAVLGLFDTRDDPDLLREALASHFGEEIRDDHEVTRLSRQVIEQRLQLATAIAAAAPDLARKASRLLPALDGRIDLIVGKARSAATRRGTARFQAGMAQLAKQRLTEVSRIAEASDSRNAATARKAADGLSAQVEATTGLVDHAENRLMVLDHAVAEYGTLVTRALLALSKADPAGLEALARDLGR
jgi:hypothetical protein